jgi:hypothetical protein
VAEATVVVDAGHILRSVPSSKSTPPMTSICHLLLTHSGSS